MLRRRIRVVRIIARLITGGPTAHVMTLNGGLDARRFTSRLVVGTESAGEQSRLDEARARGLAPWVLAEMVGELRLGLGEMMAVWKLAQWLRRERPDIVHTHTAKAGFVGRLAARLAGVPVVVHTYHGHVLYGYYGPIVSWLLRRMEQALGWLSDALIAVSPRVREDLVRYGVAPASRIDVIPLGLELDSFLAAGRPDRSVRSELGVGDGAPLIGAVGRLVPIKNYDLFLRAAAYVVAEAPATRFVVIGDGPMRSTLEATARALNLADRLTFTGWRRITPLLYAALDAVVITSDNEGTPVVALEAMATACPVVATRVGGNPDVVEHERTGLLVTAGDAGDVARAILRLVRDPGAATRLGTAARAAVGEKYQARRLVDDVEWLYMDLVARHRSRPRRLKRALDATAAALGLVASAPVLLLAATAIKLDDGGPVFLRHVRIGQAGRQFTSVKFRSMTLHAEPVHGRCRATANYAHVTRVGRLLRRTAMDQLPQLWNILVGDMSFVGPQALEPEESEVTAAGVVVAIDKVPGYDERKHVRPGLTGLAQIYAGGNAPWRHKFRLDQLYVDRQSLWLDLKLIWVSFRIRSQSSRERASLGASR